jgi:lipopolysaccharide assembly outer membrane protein LptD (OstA)
MRPLFVIALLGATLLLAGDPDINADVAVKAESVARQGPVYHLRGNATFEPSAVAIRADEIEFNQETNELELRGAVRMKLKGNPSYLFVDGTKRDPDAPPMSRRPHQVVEIIK